MARFEANRAAPLIKKHPERDSLPVLRGGRWLIDAAHGSMDKGDTEGGQA